MKGENDKSEAAKKSNEFIGERARAHARQYTLKAAEGTRKPDIDNQNRLSLKSKEEGGRTKKIILSIKLLNVLHARYTLFSLVCLSFCVGVPNVLSFFGCNLLSFFYLSYYCRFFLEIGNFTELFLATSYFVGVYILERALFIMSKFLAVVVTFNCSIYGLCALIFFLLLMFIPFCCWCLFNVFSSSRWLLMPNSIESFLAFFIYAFALPIL